MPTLGAWARTGFTWAPDVSRLDDGTYLVYYTARDIASGRQCVGAARSDSPAGPFTPVGDQPPFCPVDQHETYTEAYASAPSIDGPGSEAALR